MTTYPRAQAKKPAAAIADHGRQVTRAHARLDSVESVQSLQNTQISTAQTAISAVNTGTGGSPQENFLGGLNQVAAPTETNGGGWTSGGAILGSSQIDASVLTGWMNQVHADIAAIIAAMHSSHLST